MTEELREGTVIQRSILIGLGDEGAQICRAMYQRICDTLGWHPPVIRYLVIAYEQEVTLLRQQPDFHQFAASGTLHLLAVPPLAAAPTQHQVRGATRHAVYQWLMTSSYQVEDLLRTTARYVTRGEHKTLIQSRGDGLRVDTFPNPVFYLLGSLANILTSGLLLDLAYFVADRAVVRSEGLVNERSFSFINGIFLLPGFDDDHRLTTATLVQGSPNHQRQESQGWRWVDANVYATLKELTYYMDGNRYQNSDYADREPVIFPEGETPFQNSSCFFVGPENEIGDAGMGLADAILLIADWLTYRLVTPVGEALRRVTVGPGVYASLGLSGWTLPRHELVTYCSRRLLGELLKEVFLSTDEVAVDSGALIRANLGIMENRIRTEFERIDGWPVPLKRHLQSLSQGLQLELPLFAPRQLERALLRADGKHRNYMDELRSLLGELVLTKAMTVEAAMHERMNQMLDQNPRNGLHIARYTFRPIRDELLEERKAFTAQRNALSKQREGLTLDIRQQQARYFYAVHSFRPIEMDNSAVGLTPLLAFVGFSLLPLLIWFLLSPVLDIVAMSVTTLLSTAAIVVVSFAWYQYTRRLRNALIASYSERQRIDLQLEYQDRLIELWSKISEAATSVLNRLNTFHTQLQAMETEAQATFADQQVTFRLYDAPRHPREKSVLTPDIVEDLYKEMTSASYDNQIALLVQQSGIPYHEWINHKSQAIYAHIEAYINQRIDALSYTVTEMLERKYGSNQLKEKLRTGYAQAAPMLDLDTSASASDSEVKKITYYHQREERSKLATILEEITRAEQHISIASNHADVLMHLSMRSGFRLQELQSIYKYYPEYETLRKTGNVELLHSNKQRMMLKDSLIVAPDTLAPGSRRNASATTVDMPPLEQQIESPQDIFVFGSFLGIIQYDRATEQYSFEYLSEQASWLESIGEDVVAERIEMGSQKELAVNYLHQHAETCALLLADIHHELRRKLTEEYEESEPRLAGELHRYRMQHSDLAEWERTIIEQLINKIAKRNADSQPKPRRIRPINPQEKSAKSKTSHMPSNEQEQLGASMQNDAQTAAGLAQPKVTTTTRTQLIN